MVPFAIAGLQLDLPAAEENTARIVARVDATMAMFPWVQLVLLSELATFGTATEHAQSLPGPVEDSYRHLAARHKIWLVPGSLYELSGGHIYNTASVIDPDGTVVLRHRKLFPFRPYEAGVTAGSDLGVFVIPGVGRFGVTICYDMWFPETTRTLAAMGAEVILHPTLTTTVDRDVELAIARANAACNQCYFFDINGAGGHGVGRSIVVGPGGDVLHQAGGGNEVIPLEIDLDLVRRARAVGAHGLGQPLKSFRDRSVDLGVYRQPSDYLDSLGAIEKPHRR